jgi:hypothetical protein
MSTNRGGCKLLREIESNRAGVKRGLPDEVEKDRGSAAPTNASKTSEHRSMPRPADEQLRRRRHLQRAAIAHEVGAVTAGHQQLAPGTDRAVTSPGHPPATRWPSCGTTTSGSASSPPGRNGSSPLPPNSTRAASCGGRVRRAQTDPSFNPRPVRCAGDSQERGRPALRAVPSSGPLPTPQEWHRRRIVVAEQPSPIGAA